MSTVQPTDRSQAVNSSETKENTPATDTSILTALFTMGQY